MTTYHPSCCLVNINVRKQIINIDNDKQWSTYTPIAQLLCMQWVSNQITYLYNNYIFSRCLWNHLPKPIHIHVVVPCFSQYFFQSFISTNLIDNKLNSNSILNPQKEAERKLLPLQNSMHYSQSGVVYPKYKPITTSHSFSLYKHQILCQQRSQIMTMHT